MLRFVALPILRTTYGTPLAPLPTRIRGIAWEIMLLRIAAFVALTALQMVDASGLVQEAVRRRLWKVSDGIALRRSETL